MNPSYRAHRDRMRALVRGRFATAQGLATIAAGHYLAHTIPLPYDVTMQLRSDREAAEREWAREAAERAR